MAKKIQLQDASGNTLHPLTLGECVAMDNGENLDTLMSKSQMFTPTIAQDKSMFKVGTGVDVDYSANVKDGAYESLVFKGKSLVNLITKYRNNNTSQTLTISGRTYVVADRRDMPLKSNTKYLIQFNVSSLNLDGRTSVDLVFQQNAGVIFDGNVTASIVQTGVHSVVATTIPSLPVVTDSDWSQNAFVIKGMASQWENSASTERTLTISDVMVIEYQEGMENWDISFFEGICDVKMPILRNVGKNLLDINTLPIKVGKDICQIANGVVYSKPTTAYAPVRWIIPVEPNTTYTVSAVGSADAVLQFSNFFNTSDPSLDARISYKGSERKATTFTTATHTSITMSLFSALVKDLSIGDIQLEKESVNTTYEDYKTNILRTSEEIVLRSVGDIKDSYNALTGEYVQRIVEYVFNGSESEAWNFAEMKGDNYRFGMNLPTFGNKSADKTALICDRLKVGEAAQEPKQEQITTYNHGSYFELRITLSPSTLASNNVDELRRYLQANPITIQYAVTEPTTAIIKPSTMTPFAYQNGHAIVESGFEGQSLLPEIEYSVVTGRTGQVTQNTKVLRKQEQQIIGLEELLLTQVVQMEYERTLLQFDYELQMMMLG